MRAQLLVHAELVVLRPERKRCFLSWKIDGTRAQLVISQALSEWRVRARPWPRVLPIEILIFCRDRPSVGGLDVFARQYLLNLGKRAYYDAIL